MLTNKIKLIKLSSITSLTRTISQANPSTLDNGQDSQVDHSNENTSSNKSSNKSARKAHPFNVLYPWKTLTEFVDVLEQRIVYNDNKLIAIDKPWGVAYHKANKTLHKPYAFESLSLIPGEPKFCLNNALPMLEERLGVEKLQFVKLIDRYSSGIILLSSDDATTEAAHKSLRTNKSEGRMFYNFVCIAQGFPAIQGDELSEKVRIKLRDIDELADYKEPIITPPVYKKQDIDNGYLARVCIRINSLNRLNSASYLRISTNQLRWNFVRCYVADKAAFIVGDLRFSSNVKRILGEQVLETTNSFYKNNRIEPLNKEMLYALKVRSNRKIPVMLHLESISLRKFFGQDLVISCKLPDHFEFALKQLKLVNPNKPDNESDKVQSNQLDKLYL